MILLLTLLLSGSVAQAATPKEMDPMAMLEQIQKINWRRLHRQGQRLCATVRDRHSLAMVYTTQPQMLLMAHQAFTLYTSNLQQAYVRVRMSLRVSHPYREEGGRLAAAMEAAMVRLQTQTMQFEQELYAFEAEFDGLIYGARPFEPRRSVLISRCQGRFTRTEVMLQQSHELLFGEMHDIIPLIVSYDAHFSPPQP